MKTLMRNGRDRRSENPLWVTRRKSACFCLGPIRGSHQGQRPKRPHSKAEYMTAPERFADSQIPLAPRAPSIHDPQETIPNGVNRVRFLGLTGRGDTGRNRSVLWYGPGSLLSHSLTHTQKVTFIHQFTQSLTLCRGPSEIRLVRGRDRTVLSGVVFMGV